MIPRRGYMFLLCPLSKLPRLRLEQWKCTKFILTNLKLIIRWEGRESRTGPLRVGPMGGVSRVGH